MHYEHLIQVTDPADPRIDPMDRDALWRGLLARVHAPERFPFGPDDCRTEALDGSLRPEDATRLRRTLRYGELTLIDEVQLSPGEGLVFQPAPREGMPAIVLSLRIEEPRPALLCLRFIYRSPAEADDPETDGLRQQAWLAADRDMVRTLRTWQAQGRL